MEIPSGDLTKAIFPAGEGGEVRTAQAALRCSDTEEATSNDPKQKGGGGAAARRMRGRDGRESARHPWRPSFVEGRQRTMAGLEGTG